MEKEIWKDVVGYEGHYQVSNGGIVKSLDMIICPENKRSYKRAGRVLRPSKDRRGRMRVTLSVASIKKQFFVASLVLTAFVGARPRGFQACHFPDNNNSNNTLDNLRWDSPKNNQRDRLFNGTDCRGEKCATAKLKNNEVLKIKNLLTKNKYTIREIAEMFNVSKITIYAIKRNQNWAWLA